MSGLLRVVRWLFRIGFPLAALGLHLSVTLFYVRRWDHAAAVTVFPFWAWGILGFSLAGLSWLIFRTRLALSITVLWVISIIVGSDETKPLLRFNAVQPIAALPPDHEGKRVLRVITLNCRGQNPVSVTEVLPWQPDIVFFQESPGPWALLELAKKLYPDGNPQDHVLGGNECAIVTRGKKLGTYPTTWKVLPGTIELDGRRLHLVCVHLQGAVTAVSLHRAQTWKLHYWNRQSRRAEMVQVRQWMEVLNLARNPAPVIIAGDFNAPAGDAVFRELQPDFTNAFDAVGSGWPDTYPNFAPVLRIDHIYTNAPFTPISARTVKTANSDHRMVVADFVLN